MSSNCGQPESGETDSAGGVLVVHDFLEPISSVKKVLHEIVHNLAGRLNFVHQANTLPHPIGRELFRTLVSSFGEFVDLTERGFRN